MMHIPFSLVIQGTGSERLYHLLETILMARFFNDLVPIYVDNEADIQNIIYYLLRHCQTTLLYWITFLKT